MNIQTISLKDTVFRGCHGVTTQERELLQDFSVQLQITFDASAALASNRLADTIDYCDLVEILKAHIENSNSHILLESLVEEITHDIGQKFHCLDLDLSIRKLSLPFDASVGLHRSFLQNCDTVPL